MKTWVILHILASLLPHLFIFFPHPSSNRNMSNNCLLRWVAVSSFLPHLHNKLKYLPFRVQQNQIKRRFWRGRSWCYGACRPCMGSEVYSYYSWVGTSQTEDYKLGSMMGGDKQFHVRRNILFQAKEVYSSAYHYSNLGDWTNWRGDHWTAHCCNKCRWIASSQLEHTSYWWHEMLLFHLRHCNTLAGPCIDFKSKISKKKKLLFRLFPYFQN